ncbi:MAG: 50S ribosomal protein L1 [Acidobacteriota bacterium]
MPKHGKKFQAASAKVEAHAYDVESGVALAKEVSFARFDESLEIAMQLGVDPRHADQMVRGTLVLPHGTGRSKRVLVFAAGDKHKEAEAAGADHVGGKDLVEKIQGGWLEFDAVVATPDMMKDVGKLGRVLGPRGLMPNPKTGTVTFDVAKAVNEIKAGKVEFRVDKTAIVHAGIGRLSFDPDKLVENATTFITAVIRARPAATKGRYVKSCTLSSTMGPGIRIDISSVEKVKAGAA